MPTIITATKAVEEGTYVITASFYDEDGNAVSPDTMAWSLTDKDGTIINSREDVAISSPGTSENIVLSGNDLAITDDGHSEQVRYLVMEGTYTSALGTLPLKDQCTFYITNIKKVT
jgi:hypothetical protein